MLLRQIAMQLKAVLLVRQLCKHLTALASMHGFQSLSDEHSVLMGIM